jgi:hypothetical protein
VIVLLAVALVVMLGFAALTIDVGYAYYTKRSLQSQADASALAGAQVLPDGAAAKTIANNYSGSTGSKNARGNVPNVATSVTVTCGSTSGTCYQQNAVVVEERTHVSAIFAKVVGFDGFNVGAKAAACSLGSGSSFLVDQAGDCPVIPPPCVIGYPFSSSNARTAVTFKESEVLRDFAPEVAGPNDTIKVWYNDEHALTLGVRQVIVKKASGTTTTNYSVTSLGSNPGHTVNPQVGTTITSGDQAGIDTSDRPMYPALFITDITSDLNSKSGDWQYFGTGITPNDIFGSWKGAVRTVDYTAKTGTTYTTTPDADPSRNNWNLGPGSDAPPSGLTNEGWGAEARWNVADLGLKSLHTYRMQFMMHDGDQNKVGGDAGEACMSVLTN